MKLYHVVVLVAPMFFFVDCNQSLQLEPGLNCAGGITGVLKKYLGQRKVSPEKVSLTILGGCIFNADFSHRLADEIRKMPMTVILLSNGQLDPKRAPIFGYTVPYYCQGKLKPVYYKQMIEYMENILTFRPYILFTMSKSIGTEVTKYASVRSCRISHDHRLVDKFGFTKIKRNRLTRQIYTSLSGDLCDVKPGSLQTTTRMSIDVKIRSGNCTKPIENDREPYFIVKPISGADVRKLKRNYSSTLREYYHRYRNECIKPLAIVEPSEWALIKPLSGSFILVLSGTILTVCLLSSMGIFEEFKSLLNQVISSVVTPQPVVVPYLNGLFKFQRLLLMGLFVVLFQFVIVNDYRTEVTTELLEPDRDLKIFKMRRLSVVSLPYRGSSNVFKAVAYRYFYTRDVFCLIDTKDIREGLNIPIAKVVNGFIRWGIDDRYIQGNVLKPSRIISTIREYGLIPMTLRYIHNFSVPKYSKHFRHHGKIAKAYHRKALPASSWSPEKHWEASKELLETCFGTEACGFDGGTQKVLLKNSDLSPVFRMEHFRVTIRLFSALVIISFIVIIGELTYKYLHNAKRRNKVSPNIRVD